MPDVEESSLPFVFVGTTDHADDSFTLIDSSIYSPNQASFTWLRGFSIDSLGGYSWKGSSSGRSDGGRARFFYDYDGTFSLDGTPGETHIGYAQFDRVRMWHPLTTGVSPVLKLGSRNGSFGHALAITPVGANDVAYVGGGYFDGTWVAKATDVTVFRQIGYSHYFYQNTGLTVGASFSPAAGMVLSLLGGVAGNVILQVGGEVQAGDTFGGINAVMRLGSFGDASNVYMLASGAQTNVSVNINAKNAGAVKVTSGNVATAGNPTFEVLQGDLSIDQGVLRMARSVVGTSSATVGTASALPATPEGYLKILLDGVTKKVPFYNN